MEKVYKAGITRMPGSTYKVYKGCITVRSKPWSLEEVICWLPLNTIQDIDLEYYYYFIDDVGDLSRELKVTKHRYETTV
jgi:hypothetical protein